MSGLWRLEGCGDEFFPLWRVFFAMFYGEIAISIRKSNVVTIPIINAFSPWDDDGFETSCDTCEKPPPWL